MQYKHIEKKGDILATSLKQYQANFSDVTNDAVTSLQTNSV